LRRVLDAHLRELAGKHVASLKRRIAVPPSRRARDFHAVQRRAHAFGRRLGRLGAFRGGERADGAERRAERGVALGGGDGRDRRGDGRRVVLVRGGAGEEGAPRGAGRRAETRAREAARDQRGGASARGRARRGGARRDGAGGGDGQHRGVRCHAGIGRRRLDAREDVRREGDRTRVYPIGSRHRESHPSCE
jgi:hypothetical protein